MKKQYLSVRKAVCVLATFVFGSSVVLGVSTQMGQDSWITVIFSQIIVVPVILIYCRLMRIYPEKNLFEISTAVFGKFFGSLITIVYIWYGIYLAALVLRNFSEFIQIVSMPETPQLPIMIIVLLTAIYLTKSGIETLGKWATIALPVAVAIMLVTIFLLLNQTDINNFFPVLNHGAKEIMSTSYQVFSFPFGETVLFLGVADCIRKEDSPYKIYLLGVEVGAAILLVIIVRNITTLGVPLMQAVYFPSYVAARIINVGDFLVRIEGSISMNFILCGITKISICLLTASNGLASLFRIQQSKKMVFPVGLATLALCCIIYRSTMEMVRFSKIYSVYVVPFQILIPILLWCGGEIRLRFAGKSKLSGT